VRVSATYFDVEPQFVEWRVNLSNTVVLTGLYQLQRFRSSILDEQKEIKLLNKSMKSHLIFLSLSI
jgi:hypothetical protein